MGAADVAQLLRAAIKDGRLVFTLTNEALGGDPAPDVVKSLELVYRLGEAQSRHRSSLRMPSSSWAAPGSR